MRGTEAAAQRFRLQSERALASRLEVAETVSVAAVIQTGSLGMFLALMLSAIAVGYAFLFVFPELTGPRLFLATLTFAITAWTLWVTGYRRGLKPRLLVLTDRRLLLCELGLWFPLTVRATGEVVVEESRRVVRVQKVSESRNAVRFVLVTASDRVNARLVANDRDNLHKQFDAVAAWAAD